MYPVSSEMPAGDRPAQLFASRNGWVLGKLLRRLVELGHKELWHRMPRFPNCQIYGCVARFNILKKLAQAIEGRLDKAKICHQG